MPMSGTRFSFLLKNLMKSLFVAFGALTRSTTASEST